MLLKPYDIYLSTDEEHTQSCERIDSCFNYKTKIIPSFSYRLNQFSLLAQKGRRRKNKKRTVIYIPTSLNWDNYRIEAAYYEDAWYYKWQKLLLEFFASQNNFHFIWKVLPASNKIYDPIPNLIQDKEYKDIEYAANSFYYWITKADLALLDYPSTAFYEAAVAKLPVMSLYNTNFMKIREGAKKISLKYIDDANNKIEKDKILDVVKSEPKQFQLVLYSIIKLSEESTNPQKNLTNKRGRDSPLFTGEVYNFYKDLCIKNKMEILTQRRVSDMVQEFDMLGIINVRVISKGRGGRMREITLAITKNITEKVKAIIEESLKYR